jgi:hypothetical protein
MTSGRRLQHRAAIHGGRALARLRGEPPCLRGHRWQRRWTLFPVSGPPLEHWECPVCGGMSFCEAKPPYFG